MAAITFVTAFISSLTGMAGGVLMFAALNVFIPLRALVPIHGIVQLFNNVARSYYLRDHIRWSMCIPFGFGALLGAVVTTVLIAKYITEFFPLALLLGLIAYTLLRPKKMPEIRIADRHFFWVGIGTGFVGIVAGAVDPILAVFFVRRDLTKEEIVCNKSVMQMIIHFIKVPAYLFLGFSFLAHAELILILSCAGILGTWLGVHALRRLHPEIFMTLMKLALALAALRIAYRLYELGWPLP